MMTSPQSDKHRTPHGSHENARMSDKQSPRYSKTMASTSNFANVKLDENDVPGAKLDINDLEKYSNVQLKRWLQCRGLPVSGNRPNFYLKSRLNEANRQAIVHSLFMFVNAIVSRAGSTVP